MIPLKRPFKSGANCIRRRCFAMVRAVVCPLAEGAQGPAIRGKAFTGL